MIISCLINGNKKYSDPMAADENLICAWSAE